MSNSSMLGKIKHLFQRLLLWDLWQGLKITGKQLFKNNITVQYPEECTPKSSCFRGLHILQCYPNGEERCVACKLCETVCPTLAITIESQLRDIDQTKKANKFELDLSKCLYCGLCQEVCPLDAIIETYASNYHFKNRAAQVLTKKTLLKLGEQYETDIIRDKDVS